jgi:hypothetical protein
MTSAILGTHLWPMTVYMTYHRGATSGE